MITVLSGGVGAARFLRGLIDVVRHDQVTAIVNVGDDLVLNGLHVSPDLDTVTYTLADAIDPERGWGLDGETWQAMETLGRYGGPSWFSLGDRDLGTHLYRTHRLAEGATLTEVTAEIVRAWGLDLRVLPVTDDPLRTMVSTASGEIDFQTYFVGLQHQVPVSAVRFDGIDDARPGPKVIAAVTDAERVIIAPSNPLVSIDPLLAVPGVRDAVEKVRTRCVAVSPIIGGAALKGPADRLLRELGHESTVVGVARLYAPLATTLVIDDVDRELADAVRAEGIEPLVTDTVMRDPTIRAALARTVVDL
ncbi:MAG TPA: 2-phospho-L-lactate transferase [Acidimicrobiales bacterium]|nr:2-phospho-L-lactate transferase [Acidimicrobiales bacterium]